MKFHNFFFFMTHDPPTPVDFGSNPDPHPQLRYYLWLFLLTVSFLLQPVQPSLAGGCPGWASQQCGCPPPETIEALAWQQCCLGHVSCRRPSFFVAVKDRYDWTAPLDRPGLWQCCGSVTFLYGSADPYLWLTVPDPVPNPAQTFFLTFWRYIFIIFQS